jgi:hypothetical protein
VTPYQINVVIGTWKSRNKLLKKLFIEVVVGGMGIETWSSKSIYNHNMHTGPYVGGKSLTIGFRGGILAVYLARVLI